MASIEVVLKEWAEVSAIRQTTMQSNKTLQNQKLSIDTEKRSFEVIVKSKYTQHKGS